MNSHPLTYCSSHPNDEHVLTPNHFLYGQAGGQLAPRVIDDIAFNPRNRWHFVQDLINKCWRRWMKEYLSTLNTRNKWVDQKRNVAPGDVVLLVETSNPKGHWPLGRIQELFPGPDSQVRVVCVRTAGKDYVRPLGIITCGYPSHGLISIRFRARKENSIRCLKSVWQSRRRRDYVWVHFCFRSILIGVVVTLRVVSSV